MTIMPKDFKPTKQDLKEAVDKFLEDSLDYDLDIVMCGINPGLYSGATGWPYARPGNRFWKAIHQAGFSDRVLHPSEFRELLKSRIGMTNVVARTTNAASELSREEFVEGGKILEEKIKKYKPKVLVVLGLGAYQMAFDKPKAMMGWQKEKIGDTKIYILPSPSGLNANYSLQMIAEMMKKLV